MNEPTHWKAIALLSLGGLIGTTVAACWTRLWFINAAPIGFLFGFLLQKGGLCGTAAIGDILLTGDRRKAHGIWLSIVVAMVGFASLESLGLVELAIKPAWWLNAVVGGLLFGTGMVLAGGCVSGCLYKAASGSINSMAALLTIPIGLSLVAYGPLQGANLSMRTVVTRAPDGSVLSLPTLTGLPYLAIGLCLALTTLVIALRRHRQAGREVAPRRQGSRPARRWLTRPWRPWQAGLAIGLLAIPAYLSSVSSGRNYPLCVFTGVLSAQNLLTSREVEHVYRQAPSPANITGPDGDRAVTGPDSGRAVTGPDSGRAVTGLDSGRAVTGPDSGRPHPAPAAAKRVYWWLLLLIGGLMVGSHVAALLGGEARLRPKPSAETGVALIGGLLVGIGAAFAEGCLVGNIMSGWALLGVGSLVFGLVVVLANWGTTFLYLMGGQRRPRAG